MNRANILESGLVKNFYKQSGWKVEKWTCIYMINENTIITEIRLEHIWTGELCLHSIILSGHENCYVST